MLLPGSKMLAFLYTGFILFLMIHRSQGFNTLVTKCFLQLCMYVHVQYMYLITYVIVMVTLRLGHGLCSKFENSWDIEVINLD